MNELKQRLTERYAAGAVPWDDPLPPPEVRYTVAALAPGRALDLGAGYGRASIMMARLGWQVDGVDFVAVAVAEARLRAAVAGVTVAFHERDVTRLDFLAGPYDLVVDVGCAHALDGEDLVRYRDGVARLLRPGGLYLLYARLRPGEALGETGPRGLRESELLALWAADFGLRWVERGETTLAGGESWPSAWYWFRRGEG